MFKNLLLSVLAVVTVISCAKDPQSEKAKAEDEIAKAVSLYEAAVKQFQYASGIEVLVLSGTVPKSKEALTEVRNAYAKVRTSLLGAQSNFQRAYDRAKENDIPVKNHGQLIDNINQCASLVSNMNNKMQALDKEISEAKPKSEIKVNGKRQLDA